VRVWVVGQYLAEQSWAMVGVYSTQAGAEEACVQEDHFVAPITVDTPPMRESLEWPGLYYPWVEQRVSLN
jgi:hypothetical protein